MAEVAGQLLKTEREAELFNEIRGKVLALSPESRRIFHEDTQLRMQLRLSPEVE